VLYSSKSSGKPGPKGPDQELIRLVVDIKHRNPRMGYDRVAMQVLQAFGVEVDKHVIRRILAKHYQPIYPGGPSWLTFLDQTLFWNETDLSRKLAQYTTYYNEFRGHLSWGGKTPVQIAEKACVPKQPIRNYSWISHCNGLFNTPMALSTRFRTGQVAAAGWNADATRLRE
jgi:hypothetical protein